VAGGLLLAVGAGLIAVALTGSDSVGVVDSRSVGQSTADATPMVIETVAATSPPPKATKAAQADKDKDKGKDKGKTEQPRNNTAGQGVATVAPTKKAKKPKKVQPIRPVVGTPYRLFNVLTGHCLGSMTGSDTTKVKQEECANSESLRLQVTREVAGATLYQLRDVTGANKCLDPPGTGSNGAGTEVVANVCLPPAGDNQEWQLKSIGQTVKGRAVYLIINSASGLCLDVAGVAADQADLNTGANLTLFPCASAAENFDDHRWVFTG
jgi:hypothetical protein